MSRFTVSRYAIDERGKAKHPTNSDRKSGSALMHDGVYSNEIKSAHVSIFAHWAVFHDIVTLLNVIAYAHC
jgi:hypothetical protein